MPPASQHFPAEAADVFDTSGAGDTALATLGAALAAQLDLPVAVRLANLAAGISVGKVGASVVREADLLAALTPQHSALRKIVSRRGGRGAGGTLAPPRLAGRFHQRVLRPAAPGPYRSAGAGPRRPATG